MASKYGNTSTKKVKRAMQERKHGTLRSGRSGRKVTSRKVAPSPVWTPLNRSDKSSKGITPFGAQTPMKRPAQPEEIAPAYVFLASAQCSSYTTGEILPVIGGYAGG
jgi:NAD(P)-dependent dehydrogenase (short-subunit alcohol dehydrogenase family)